MAAAITEETSPTEFEVGAYRSILGIQFFVGGASEAVDIGARGGLVVAPAAPALLDLTENAEYREALVHSDLAITDSGFLVLVWNALTRDDICRVSGLEYLKMLLRRPEFQISGSVFWVMPSKSSAKRNLDWLQEQGFPTKAEDMYIAPKYPSTNIQDKKLVQIINNRRPAHVIICVGGGVQERLGLYLKRHCQFGLGIHCTGAAIGFLNGDQVRIPDWADRWVLGWFFRCVSDPRRCVPRYAKAFKLAMLLRQYGSRLPEMRMSIARRFEAV